MPRFTFDDPPHWANPALINWQVWDNGQRVSVGQLVRLANQLQNELNQIKQEQEHVESTTYSNNPQLSPRIISVEMVAP